MALLFVGSICTLRTGWLGGLARSAANDPVELSVRVSVPRQSLTSAIRSLYGPPFTRPGTSYATSVGQPPAEPIPINKMYFALKRTGVPPMVKEMDFRNLPL
jgi:hypothetical protein